MAKQCSKGEQVPENFQIGRKRLSVGHGEVVLDILDQGLTEGLEPLALRSVNLARQETASAELFERGIE